MNTELIKISEVPKVVFCISIASKQFMRKEIDKIFEKDKVGYIKLYKESDIHEATLITSLQYELEQYTVRVAGIVEKAIKTKDYSDMLKLYKLAHKRIYNAFKNKKTIFLNDIIKLLSDGSESTNELLSTAFIFDLIKELEATAQLVDDINKITNDLYSLELYESRNFSDQVINDYKEELTKMKNILGIGRKLYTMEELINDILEKDLNNYNKNKNIVNKADIISIQKVGDMSKYIGSLEGIFKYLKIHTSSLGVNVTFTQKEINQMLLNFIFAELFNNITDEEMIRTVINVIYLTALNKEYKALKKSYSININEEHLIETEKLQKDLNYAMQEAESLKAEIIAKAKNVEEKEKTILNENLSIKKEYDRLKSEFEEMKSLKNEVVKLREFLFNLDEEIVLEDINEIDIDKLNKLKVCICGGNINWVKKLKEVFTEWYFVGGEQKNNDLSFFKNCDFILLNAKMPHALYFKVTATAEKYNKNYDYIKTNENISISINYINSKLKENNLI